MRSGTYTEKDKSRLAPSAAHRVVVPIFIPSLNDYFENALEVLRLHLASLRQTVGSTVRVSIISNASTEPVKRLLQSHFAEGWVDQLVFSQRNLGKVDALVQQLRAAHEPFVTIADADSLFSPGWLAAVERIFLAFPEAGAVAPIPNPRATWSLTSATLIAGFLRREIKSEGVVPQQDLERFAESLGNPSFFTDDQKKAQLIVRRNGVTACVGCGHFVVTLRREVAAGIPDEPSLTAVSNDSERLWLDAPVDRQGFWRLSTTRAYVHHMGNVPEPWMREELGRSSVDSPETPQELPPARRSGAALLPPLARRVLARQVRRILERRNPVDRADTQ